MSRMSRATWLPPASWPCPGGLWSFTRWVLRVAGCHAGWEGAAGMLNRGVSWVKGTLRALLHRAQRQGGAGSPARGGLGWGWGSDRSSRQWRAKLGKTRNPPASSSARPPHPQLGFPIGWTQQEGRAGAGQTERIGEGMGGGGWRLEGGLLSWSPTLPLALRPGCQCQSARKSPVPYPQHSW